MLKRQRPASPPLSIPTIPLIVDPLPFGSEAGRDFKRRRVLPPSLDGRSRGWGMPEDGDDGDEEAYMSSEDELVEENGDRAACTAHTSEYKKANNVLHELHALHQHRVLFSSPQPSNSHPQLNQRSPVDVSSPGVNNSAAPSTLITTQHPVMEVKDPAFEASDSAYSGEHLSKDEVHRVTERYEDTNRSRRLSAARVMQYLTSMLLKGTGISVPISKTTTRGRGRRLPHTLIDYQISLYFMASSHTGIPASV